MIADSDCNVSGVSGRESGRRSSDLASGGRALSLSFPDFPEDNWKPIIKPVVPAAKPTTFDRGQSSIATLLADNHVVHGDTRHRRVSMIRSGYSVLKDPSVTLSKADRFATVFGLGTPGKDKFRKALFLTLTAVSHIAIAYILNDARLHNGMSWLLQLTFVAIQVELLYQLYHVRANLLFVNMLIFSQRLERIANLGERDDLVKKIDDITDGLVTGICIQFTIMIVIVGCIAFFYITDESIPISSIAAVSFMVCYVPSLFFDASWESIAAFHQIQIEMFHDTLLQSFTDMGDEDHPTDYLDQAWSKKMTVQVSAMRFRVPRAPLCDACASNVCAHTWYLICSHLCLAVY